MQFSIDIFFQLTQKKSEFFWYMSQPFIAMTIKKKRYIVQPYYFIELPLSKMVLVNLSWAFIVKGKNRRSEAVSLPLSISELKQVQWLCITGIVLFSS